MSDYLWQWRSALLQAIYQRVYDCKCEDLFSSFWLKLKVVRQPVRLGLRTQSLNVSHTGYFSRPGLRPGRDC